MVFADFSWLARNVDSDCVGELLLMEGSICLSSNSDEGSASNFWERPSSAVCTSLSLRRVEGPRNICLDV